MTSYEAPALFLAPSSSLLWAGAQEVSDNLYCRWREYWEGFLLFFFNAVFQSQQTNLFFFIIPQFWNFHEAPSSRKLFLLASWLSSQSESWFPKQNCANYFYYTHWPHSLRQWQPEKSCDAGACPYVLLISNYTGAELPNQNLPPFSITMGFLSVLSLLTSPNSAPKHIRAHTHTQIPHAEIAC